MTEAVLAYQKDTEKISRSIARATARARNDLTEDAEKILGAYAKAGGFDSLAEAKAYMDRDISESERQLLIQRAHQTYTGKRLEQELVRLSAPAYRYRISRAEAIKKSADMAAKRLDRDIREELVPGVDATVREASARTEFGVQKEAGVALDWTLPNKDQLRSVHRDIGVYDRVKLFSASELESARTAISRGILSGRSLDDISRQVERETGKAPYKARRLVRTTMAQAAADAEARKLAELGVEEYEIVCTLDERTCSVCAGYDGQVHPLGKGPMPTFHPNCRCSIRQVMPPEVKARMRRAARDEDGKHITIPASMTYREWLEEYGPKTSVPEPPRKKADTPMQVPDHFRAMAEAVSPTPGGDRTTRRTRKITDAEWRTKTPEEQAELFRRRMDVLKNSAPRTSAKGERVFREPIATAEELTDKEWEDSLSKQARGAIIAYTGKGARAWINKSLYETNMRLGRFKAPKALTQKKIYDLIDQTISSYFLKRAITVYRGMETNPFGPVDSLIGRVVTMEGYTSTSLKRKVAKKFEDKYLWVITVPPGKGQGAFIGNISKTRSQQEFLLKRGATLFPYNIIEENGKYTIFAYMM